MKFIFSVLLIAWSINAVAANALKLNIVLNIDGKKSEPLIITNLNQETSIRSQDNNGNGYELKVLAEEVESIDIHSKQDFDFSFQLYKLSKNKVKLLSSPKIRTPLNKRAKTELSEETKNVSLEFKATTL